jgi:osmotically-inducible protein OsmY
MITKIFLIFLFCQQVLAFETLFSHGTVDQQLSENVAQRLYRDQLYSPKVIQIKSNGNIVTLEGSLNDVRSRDRAVSLAKSVRGVSGVIDEIKIQNLIKATELKSNDSMRTQSDDTESHSIIHDNDEFAHKLPRNDDEIQVSATRSLNLDPRTRSCHFHVDVNHNVATLSGVSRNLNAKTSAIDDLKNTVGVAKVEDKTSIALEAK